MAVVLVEHGDGRERSERLWLARASQHVKFDGLTEAQREKRRVPVAYLPQRVKASWRGTSGHVRVVALLSRTGNPRLEGREGERGSIARDGRGPGCGEP